MNLFNWLKTIIYEIKITGSNPLPSRRLKKKKYIHRKIWNTWQNLSENERKILLLYYYYFNIIIIFWTLKLCFAISQEARVQNITTETETPHTWKKRGVKWMRNQRTFPMSHKKKKGTFPESRQFCAVLPLNQLRRLPISCSKHIPFAPISLTKSQKRKP